MKMKKQLMPTQAVQFESVEETDRAPAGTYIGFFRDKNIENRFAFSTVRITKPVHPEEIVHYFQERVLEKGLNPDTTWVQIREPESGFRLTFLWNGATPEEYREFAQREYEESVR
jgi:hypothetical protein